MRTITLSIVIAALSLAQSVSAQSSPVDSPKPNDVAVEQLEAEQITAEPAVVQSSSDVVVIGVVAAPECGDRAGAERLAQAVQDRMIDALVLAGPPVGAPMSVDVTWHDGGAGCVVRLRAGDTDASVELSADPDDASLDAAAVRIAWLADAYAQAVPSRLDEAAFAQIIEEPTDPVPTFDGQYDLQRAGLSVADGLNVANGDPDRIVRNFSFTLAGSRIAGLRGLEFGLLYNRETSFAQGLQISVGANIVEGEVRGVQWSSVFNYAETLVGLQWSGVNIARDGVVGAQVGAVNYTRGRVKGLQLGFVNVAASSAVSIGLINIMREEPVYGLAWADSDGALRIGIEHGSEHFRNILAFGIDPLGDVSRWSVGGGFAVHLPVRRVYFQLDVLGFVQGAIGDVPTFTVDTTNEEVTVSRLEALGQARLLLGVPIANRFALYTGIAQNVLFTEDQDHDQPWARAKWSRASGDIGFYLWPSFVVGARF
ncbi:MAG: hypothetical protein ACI81R_002662 [Bradymonadia bacterium]|jgi:hypothetical protein